MTYEELVNKVIKAFEAIDDEKQVPYVVKSLNSVNTWFDEVTIFPMKDLSSFCKKYFQEDYEYLLAVMENSYYNEDGFTIDDKWVLWNEATQHFSSKSRVFDFVTDVEVLVDEIFMDTEGLKVLGFSEKEEKELRDVFNQAGND